MPSLRVARASGGALAAIAALILSTTPASAHTPTAGYSQDSFGATQGQIVTYRWGGSYSTWMTAAAQDSLDTKYRSWTNNNSGGPEPRYSSSGTATVYYRAASLSPCNPDPNPQWLQCTSSGGTTGFRIYVRDLENSKYSDWVWWDRAQACIQTNGTPSTTCWYIRRAMIHEAGHAIPTFNHDSQGESNTVMGALSPEVDQTGGNRFVFQRCDQAALQLLWDVKDPSRPYGDCFDHVAGHGVRGLVTTATTNGTSFSGCVSSGRLVGGRLAVKAEPLYGRLSNNPLAGRTLRFDRKSRTATTWTLNAESTVATAAETGTNWTRTFPAPSSLGGTYDYRAHFDGDLGLDPSNAAPFSIAWSASC